jgi:hypothetical protein
MNQDELITYNGKQYKFKDLPPEVQDVLKDENNNGIPDRLEPKVTTPQQSKFEAPLVSTTETAVPQKVQVENIALSILKKYLSTSTFFLIATLAGGIVIFIVIFLLGVARS